MQVRKFTCGLSLLVYKHDDFDEWAIFKKVRDLRIHADVSPDDGASGMCSIKVQAQVDLQDVAIGFPDVRLGWGTQLGAILDKILHHVRASGDFSEQEVSRKMATWTCGPTREAMALGKRLTIRTTFPARRIAQPAPPAPAPLPAPQAPVAFQQNLGNQNVEHDLNSDNDSNSDSQNAQAQHPRRQRRRLQ